jgi:hypothetical protein
LSASRLGNVELGDIMAGGAEMQALMADVARATPR